jgi:hypothetical protein
MGRVKSIKASSIEAFSGYDFRIHDRWGLVVSDTAQLTYFTVWRTFFEYCDDLCALATIIVQ